MIIDVRTHVWSNLDQLGREVAQRLRATQAERWGHLDGTLVSHEQATSCVDAAVVLGFRSDRTGARIPNEYVAQAVSSRAGRVYGVAGVDPMSDDAVDQLDAAIDLGLIGISVAPALQGFHPAHSAAMRLYERCVELAMPVFVVVPHPLTSSASMEFGRALLWDEVARSFPTLRIVIGEVGAPWVEETLVLVGKHEHLYAEISGVATRPWQLYNTLLLASGRGVMGKLLFGSGFPYETPAKTIEALYSVNAMTQGTPLPSVPRASIRAIVERDSLACLGLDVDVPPPPLATEMPDGAIRESVGESDGA
jgi:predicted TIM-barrel fold metal-dependent hydrolase